MVRAWASASISSAPQTIANRAPLTEAVIGLAIEVHRTLGPGLFESVYETCLCRELTNAGIAFQTQVAIPVEYKGQRLEAGFRADLIVQNKLIIEIKSVEKIAPLHEAQLLTYLRLGSFPKGLLIDFNARLPKDGIRRFVV